MIIMPETKDNLKKRISYLIDFAIFEQECKTGNPYTAEYVQLAFDISKKINYRVPQSIHLKVCKYCYAIRTAGNTKARVVTETKNHKKVKYLKLHCLECNNIKKIKV